MLAIRFARMGKKNKAQFQIVLQEHTVAPGGRHIEVLGSYDPHSKQAVLKEEKIKEWIGKGAQLSDTVHNLLLAKGIITGEKRKVKMPAKAVAEEVKVEEKAEANPPAGGEENLPSEIPSEAGKGEAAISPGKEEVKAEENKEVKEEVKAEAPLAEQAKEEVRVEEKAGVKTEAPKEEVKKA